MALRVSFADCGIASEQTSQVNSVLSHPTESIIVGGYEDGYIRTFDSETCELHFTLPHVS